MAKSIVLIADPRVVAIPIVENHEPLIDLRKQTDILYGPSPEIENNTAYTHIRTSVYHKLLEAQRRLPSHLRICLYEGLRTLDLQKQLFDERWHKVKAQNPQWTEQDIYLETIKMVSPLKTLDGKVNIPPHSTGAAVDVYLVETHSLSPIDMGILCKDWLRDLDGQLSSTDSPSISAEAKKNRALLNEVMLSVDFVNYPTEYWHWSYGDRYWAFIQDKPEAMYGVV